MIKPAGADSARLRVGEFTKEQSTHDHRGVSPYVLAEALFDATGKKKNTSHNQSCAKCKASILVS